MEEGAELNMEKQGQSVMVSSVAPIQSVCLSILWSKEAKQESVVSHVGKLELCRTGHPFLTKNAHDKFYA